MPSAITKNNTSPHRILLFLLFASFIVSGATSLAYEVVWFRQLSTLLGSSSVALTIILMAFMGGLGLGSWVLGRQGDRLLPPGLILTYACLEAGIGLYALLFPTILDWYEAAYINLYHLMGGNVFSFSLLRFVLGFLMLMLPTFMMGGTLPLATRFLMSFSIDLSGNISRLYALNTAGALAGTLLTGYLLIPAIGVNSTTYLAVSGNFTIAIILILTVKLIYGGETVWPSRASILTSLERIKLPASQKWFVFAYGLAGAAAMIYEVAWVRSLSMILGTTTYAFTTMLATFLAGLALGSALYRRWGAKRNALLLFLVLQLTVSFTALLAVPFMEEIPFLFMNLKQSHFGWLGLQSTRFIICALIMLPTCVAMGMSMPAAMALFKGSNVSSRVGILYAGNTFGSVAGAGLGGLVIVPLAGMQNAILIAVGINIMVAIIVFWVFSETKNLHRRYLFPAFSIGLYGMAIFTIPPWRPEIMSSGVYLYKDLYLQTSENYNRVARQSEKIAVQNDKALWKAIMMQYKVLFYKTGITSTVAVMEDRDGTRSLMIDGKIDASNGRDMRTQVLLAHLPLAFHPDPQRVFVVGLGSGVTVGSALTHSIGELICSEMSPAVVQASQYFKDVNNNPLGDARLSIVERDARAFLKTEGRPFDVIISQPSNLWIKGESNLFTYEWYQLIYDHLQEGGLFVQWLPAYNISQNEFLIVMHTLKTVFPNLTAWTSGIPGDLYLLASKGRKLQIDSNVLLSRLNSERIRQDLLRVAAAPKDFLERSFVMNRAELTDYIYSSSDHRPLQLNTTDHLITEYLTPKQLERGARVERFTDPETMHGNLLSLMDIISVVETKKIIE